MQRGLLDTSTQGADVNKQASAREGNACEVIIGG